MDRRFTAELSRWRHGLAVLAATLGLGAAPAAAAPQACLEAIGAVERAEPVPPGLLRAIALVESGRRTADGAFVPWPWTINSPKGAFFLDGPAAAVAKVEELKAAGVRNIDVGCMQVNLHHHPEAFASLEEAFDPRRNVAYAASFLRALEGAAPSLFDAVGRYHSHTPERSQAYAQRVFARWGQPVPPGADVAPDTGGPRFYRKGPKGWLVRMGDGAWQPLDEVPTRRLGVAASGFDGWAAGRPRRTR